MVYFDFHIASHAVWISGEVFIDQIQKSGSCVRPLAPAGFPTGPFPSEIFEIWWSMLVEMDWISSSATQPNGHV
jgi:hypothetical protein